MFTLSELSSIWKRKLGSEDFDPRTAYFGDLRMHRNLSQHAEKLHAMMGQMRGRAHGRRGYRGGRPPMQDDRNENFENASLESQNKRPENPSSDTTQND